MGHSSVSNTESTQFDLILIIIVVGILIKKLINLNTEDILI